MKTVDVGGSLTRIVAGSGPEGWILTTSDGTLLAVTLPSAQRRPMRQRCVSILVDDDFPEDEHVVAALEQLMNDSGEALVVTAFC